MNYVSESDLFLLFYPNIFELIIFFFLYLLINTYFILFLAWLLIFLTTGQICVHEICQYPNVQNTFYLWSDEDCACVKNIWIECISNDQCLIFITKMSFVLIILYSLPEKKIISLKKEMIPKTAFIPGSFNILSV